MTQTAQSSWIGSLSARRDELVRPALGLLFILTVMLLIYTGFDSTLSGHGLLVAGGVIGAYMAINIGANDVANNVGPAVGSKALTLGGAILIAAIFEASGALIAGGDVVSTIKNGIIDPELIQDQDTFVWLMLAALLSGAIWLNLATAIGTPVSTTHSIVGSVLGAGIAATGWDIANWSTVGAIAASWVISPVMGGVIAASFLYVIKRKITYQRDKIRAAGKVLPLLVGIMVWAFSTYLILKGLNKIWSLEFWQAALLGSVIATTAYYALKPAIARKAATLPNSKESINQLFTIPLIFSAALLSFAHGANDVANAVGPLAAISSAVLEGGVATQAAIPLWVMVIGALGITVGLALFGPRLIRTVGTEITDLDQSRAFCIALAAALTVIIASQLGLPVSSTHITVGAVFGVGFLREYLKANYAGLVEEIRHHHQGKNEMEVQLFLQHFDAARIRQKEEMLKQLKARNAHVPALKKKERKALRGVYKEQLVKRSALLKIVAAWLITVPASAVLAATIFYTIRGMLLP